MPPPLGDTASIWSYWSDICLGDTLLGYGAIEVTFDLVTLLVYEATEVNKPFTNISIHKLGVDFESG